MIVVRKGNQLHQVIKTEEHIVLLAEPESTFYGHITQSSDTSSNITKSIIDFLTDNDKRKFNISKLIVLGCDGTNVNTGHKNKVIPLLEKLVSHKLHWFMCLLYTNELPLCHLFQTVDGKAFGLNQYSGPIEKVFESCKLLPVVPYIPILILLPEVNLNHFSRDQKYLFEICHTVSSGDFSSSL